MNRVDSNTHAYDGQRRQQRHVEGAQPGTYQQPAPGPEGFLMTDAPGTFTFSAEPTSMTYDSTMATIPSSRTPSQDAIFTPNAGTSFDSALHPDMSWPPPNAYPHNQNYSLSPGSYYGNGQGISPSHSVEHLSPEGGYMSDPTYQDPSNYSTPNFNGRVLEEFSGLTFVDPSPTNNFTNFPENVNMNLLTSNTLNTYNAQAHNPIMLEPQHQLLSPSVTQNSSPALGDDSSTFPTMNNYVANMSTPPSHTTHLQHSTPIHQTQSPALTNSPGNAGVQGIRPLVRHFTSPIVRVENYSDQDSPPRSDNSRPVSKRSHGSRSANHLSPYPPQDSSDEEDFHQNVRTVPVIQNHQRNEDGSWLKTGSSGQSGLSPDDRQTMGDAFVQSIEELAEMRSRNEKKLEVQEWLTKSEVGSEAGDIETSNSLSVPHTGRRRAKSTNDMHRRGMQGSFGLGVRTDFDHIDDSGIPGPGLYIDERSDFDDDLDDDDYSAEPESPPAVIDVQSTGMDNSYFPSVRDSVNMDTVVRPWVDPPSEAMTNPPTRYQPQTSVAAMQRFLRRAKDVESASLAATIGSRRLSESDLGSIRASPGIAKLIEPDPKKSVTRSRRPSFLENILPNRKPANLLKRKGSVPVPPAEIGAEKAKELVEKPKTIERIQSWGRPKTPRVDTNLSSGSKEGGPPSSTGLTPNSGPWYQNVIKRNRSRSDLGRSPGLAELLTQHGGPPMPMLASPLAETEATKPQIQPSPAGDDDDDEAEPVTMDLKVRTDPILPTYEGFRTHARQLNPRLADYMVERITQEQMRRYKRLLEFKVKHLNAVKNKNCPSGKFCPDLGGEAKQLTPRAGNKDADAPFIGFQITAPGSSEDDGEAPPEGTVVSAQFPSGVPLPPVKRLPAEFECPLCFKVKKFYKPSDWTKHVHEDVQPFTCTFPNCGEPKSFKRKADWVRHENERHRQLENWTCQKPDCSHTCYRKDNFVQHLVREHKIAEPRQRTGRAAAKDHSAGADPDDIWTIVEQCRRDTNKLPRDEPCRFCGNICNSWKKLTVHLAKHMEQISMPILPLVEQKHLNADSIISPVVELPESRKLSMTPNRSPVDGHGRYNGVSTLAPGIDPSGLYPQGVKIDANTHVMQTYPPPQLMPYKDQPAGRVNGYANYASNAQTYPNQTYPGVHEPPKPRGPYTNGLQIPNQTFTGVDGQNGMNQYGMTPVSAVQQQVVYTDSPIDTTTFPNYYPQDAQHVTGDMTDMGYNQTAHYQQQGTFSAMSYLTTQHNNNNNNYQFQGQ